MSAGPEGRVEVAPARPIPRTEGLSKDPDLIVVLAGPGRAEAIAEACAGLGRLKLTADLGAATEAASAGLPGLVVADAASDAFEFVRWLRSLPHGALVPIVVVGAQAGIADASAPTEAGADDVLAEVEGSRLRAVCAARLARVQAWHGALAATETARDRAEAAGRARDEFLGMASHELRTPLGALLIWTQLLQTETMDADGLARALGMIERSARNLARLVDDLLDATGIATGKLRLDLRPVALGPLAEAAVGAARSSEEGRGVRVEMAGGNATRSVSGDSNRLQQVVGNLLSVAVKAAPPDSLVTVRVEDVEAGVRLTVGPGNGGPCATEDQRKLGLRLTLARQLVELHGGTFEAGSEGGPFRVTLPSLAAVTAVAQALPPRAAVPAPVPSLETLRGIHVLLVDDEDDARDALRMVLERSGARVMAVGSAGAAFEAIKAEPPDVLLSDISMPHEDGYSLIRKVRALPPGQGGGVPAAAVTAYASDRDRERALSAGYLAHVAKPVEPRALVELVARLARDASSPPGLP